MFSLHILYHHILAWEGGPQPRAHFCFGGVGRAQQVVTLRFWRSHGGSWTATLLTVQWPDGRLCGVAQSRPVTFTFTSKQVSAHLASQRLVVWFVVRQNQAGTFHFSAARKSKKNKVAPFPPTSVLTAAACAAGGNKHIWLCWRSVFATRVPRLRTKSIRLWLKSTLGLEKRARTHLFSVDTGRGSRRDQDAEPSGSKERKRKIVLQKRYFFKSTLRNVEYHQKRSLATSDSTDAEDYLTSLANTQRHTRYDFLCSFAEFF